MKDRIRKVMEYAQLSQQDFAAKIEISPSSLSGVFTGRTNPTTKIVAAIHAAFPEINVGWLMFGDGEMLSPENENAQPLSEGALFASVPEAGAGENALFDASQHPETEKTASASPAVAPVPLASAPVSPEIVRQKVENIATAAAERAVLRETMINVDKKTRKIKEIRVFFDDGTFEAFVPASK